MYSWKPKTFSYGRRWIVGFRYIYFHERVIENQDFPDRLEIFWSFTRSTQPTGHLNFYYRVHVGLIKQRMKNMAMVFSSLNRDLQDLRIYR